MIAEIGKSEINLIKIIKIDYLKNYLDEKLNHIKLKIIYLNL